MTDQQPTQNKDLRKKLQKREQRMLALLQEAQQVQAKALDRFRRAEARLQKRTARVQRAEERLRLVRQQLEVLHASSPAVEPPVASPTPTETGDNRGSTPEAPTTGTDADRVKEARAAANATEENVRWAAERAATVAQHPQSPREEPAKIAKIEAEEESVEAVAAVTIAEVAAERAAEAEALAEASSAQTREARQRAQQAEAALGEVRVAIRDGLLTGEEAETALQHAEREVTHAQALLADAEAAEEQALDTAMNAEADAEVAEGMAYAAVDRAAPPSGEEQADHEETGQAQEVVEVEPDVTIKIPRVHPQENS